MGERNESAEQETWQEAKCSKAIRQKKSGEKKQRTARNGDMLSPKNLQQQTVQN